MRIFTKKNRSDAFKIRRRDKILKSKYTITILKIISHIGHQICPKYSATSMDLSYLFLIIIIIIKDKCLIGLYFIGK